jgi:hypothetical protein
MIPQAAEEFVRYYPPVVALGRSVTTDVEIGGYKFKKGDYVLLNYAAASRDPGALDNPTELNIYRKSVPHSAFGVGVHRCIGAPRAAGTQGHVRGIPPAHPGIPHEARARSRFRDRDTPEHEVTAPGVPLGMRKAR